MSQIVELSDADRLRAQADALQARGFALIREGEELKAEAVELRVEAERMSREPVTVTPSRRALAVEHDADVMARVCETLEREPMNATDVANHVGITQTRARTALGRLEAIGMVARTGIKNATRYRLTADEDAPDTLGNVRTFQNYATVVRDAALKLDTFTIADMTEALPELSEPTIRRHVVAMVKRGMLTEERVGTAKVYALATAPNTHTSRERKATPEQLAVHEFARTRSSAPVAGTRSMRVGSTIVNQLIREVRQADPTVEVSTSAHRVEFRRGGVVVATASKTPGASSLKQTRSELRKAGVAV